MTVDARTAVSRTRHGALRNEVLQTHADGLADKAQDVLGVVGAVGVVDDAIAQTIHKAPD